jgi:hypothetical protein
MTIAIAAAGPRAGRAVYEALKAAEKIGTMSIGGFVTFACLTQLGDLLRSETQRGGSSTLFVDGERNGVEPPAAVAEAVSAALISSGPDRPIPLSQFVPADSRGGLVTGHRLPTCFGITDKPMNSETLELLIAGQTAREAVDAVIAANPMSDCGLIAVDRSGLVYGRNSVRVQNRPDVHTAEMSLSDPPGKVIAFQNAIQPYRIVAEVAAAIAHQVMRGPIVPDDWLTVDTGLPVQLGEDSAIYCDGNLKAQYVVTIDPSILKGSQPASAMYLNSKVYRDKVIVGRTVGDLLCMMQDGKIVTFSGQKHTRLGFVRV